MAEADPSEGNWFKQNPGKREQIFLATKFANCSDADGNRYVDSTPEYCRAACLKSLNRLGVDHIDLCESRKTYLAGLKLQTDACRLCPQVRWQDTSREDS